MKGGREEGGRKEGNWFNISKVATYLCIKYKYQKSELSVLSQKSIQSQSNSQDLV